MCVVTAIFSFSFAETVVSMFSTYVVQWFLLVALLCARLRSRLSMKRFFFQTRVLMWYVFVQGIHIVLH
ncbi:hypothetical protein F5880DRAFT_1211021 [Lentinula raphanica]|nr:hypothetical protein F5880DRAFT_1211021 [Lentinula raphanica]